jgi:RNA-binding protein PNO1
MPAALALFSLIRKETTPFVFTVYTRQLISHRKIHILGSFQNIKIARDAIVSLILGSPPGKVYAGLRTVASRMKQRAL